MERVRLRRVFDQGLDHEVGFVLPIRREDGGQGRAPWLSGPWHFRDDRMYLIPGDSPMGYRLPLDALPWVSEADYPYVHAHDPFAPRRCLGRCQPVACAVRAAQRGRRLCAKVAPCLCRGKGLGGWAGLAHGERRLPANANAVPAALSPPPGSPVPLCAWKCAIPIVPAAQG